jgi:hypothetical protein
MTTARRAVLLVAVVLGTALSGGVARAQDAGVAATACGLSQRITQHTPGGTWMYSRPNAFDTSGQQLCISGSTRHPGFTITTNLRYTGAWQAYPFTGVGCAYNLCSRNTDLPTQVRSLPAVMNTSWTWHGSARGDWNASYDIWFDHHDQITREDDGAELMIWLRPTPGYHGGVKVNVGKHRYWFIHWLACSPKTSAASEPGAPDAPASSAAAAPPVTPPTAQGTGRPGPTVPTAPGPAAGRTCWNYTQFRFLQVMHGVRRLWLVPFIRFLEQQHLMRPSWWLTSVHAGYELVSGGKGLTTTWFNVHHA